MALFESYDRRIDQITPVLNKYGMRLLEEAEEICDAKGVDVCSNRARASSRSALKTPAGPIPWAPPSPSRRAQKKAADIAATLGEGLQAFCIPGSVADDRKVGIGHGNLAAMLLREETKCFAFLAGHESFAAAEGAIGIARSANRVRKNPLRVILNGLGKDAAQIISRINGFTYVQTQFDYATGELQGRQRDRLFRGRPGQGPLLRRRRCPRRRGHQPPGRRRCLHHRQLHQPHPLPASGGRHLQERMHRAGQEILLGGLRRRHRPHPASRQHGAPVPPPTA